MTTENQLNLRRALILDAAASGATALLMVAGAGALESLLGLPPVLLRGAGLVLVPYIAFVGWLATRGHIATPAVYAVIAINALWTLASFALLASGAVAPTLLGAAFIAGQALAVAGLGVLQAVAIRSPHRAAA
jgi:hypothetical protein